jgi:Ser/Thr protein kinase RdoA (MazF antagonist)
MDKAAAARAFTAAARAALKAFPIAPADLELVAIGENITFRVTDAADGAAYTVRLHRPGYHTLEELISERVWTRALEADGIAVPSGIRTRDGGDYVEVPVPATGERRAAGMIRWVEGEILADVLRKSPRTEEITPYLTQLGEIAGAMHNQSAAWTPPPGFRRHTLDAEGLVGETPFWGPFWEHPALSAGERDLLLNTRERVRAALARLGRRPDNFGLIHADLHDGNVLAAGDSLHVIDFDDAGFGWHAYDVAVALGPYRERPDYAVLQAAFLVGYDAGRAGSEAIAPLIPMFVMIRDIVQIGWLHQRPEIDVGDRLRGILDRACSLCAAFEPPS